ncbi:glycosyltransferase family 4 protein [Candidatus Paracaedibacter symbiosus]|uniref:glycosyltransferase family 4 protein n=1 Tax=Candidatus Paracaedibacter symbiosus TaxID=244582 RepID=UPI000509EB3B|nr:glycosyltransferase family 4 protein [Candidatus Paracaedibacter symbiosus]
MNILFIADNFPPETNAAASRVFERAKHWVKAGHHVTFLTSAPNFPQGKVYAGYKNRWYQKEIMDGMTVIRVKTFIVPNSGFLLRIIDFLSFMVMAIIVGIFLRKKEVIVATSPQFFAGYAGLILAKIKRTPFVLELSDLWPESIKGVSLLGDSKLYRLLEKFELFMYRKSCQIITQTVAFEKSLVNRGIDKSKITTVLNGVDTSFFKPQPLKNKSLVQEFGLEGKKVIGYLGTMGMAHDLTYALKMAKQLENKNIVFLFVGTGAKKAHLERYTKEHQISNVIFIPPQKKIDIQKWWSICDVALVHLKNDPAFSSVIPSKIFEAMAVAKPIVVVAPAGEASNIVLTNQIGIHLGNYDLGEDANALFNLLNNVEQLQSFSLNMVKFAASYDRAIPAKRFMEVLNKAQGNPPKIKES